MKKIGKTDKEIDVGKLNECRVIVKNIVNFGVNEKQKIQIIKLLSLELESRKSMNIIVDAVKKIYDLKEDNKFILNDEKTNYNDKKSKLLDV